MNILPLKNKNKTKNSFIGNNNLNNRLYQIKFNNTIDEIFNHEGTTHYEENKLTFEKLDGFDNPSTSRNNGNYEIGEKTRNKSQEKEFALAAFKPIKAREINYMKRKVNNYN